MACREPLVTKDIESKRAAVSLTTGSPAPKSEPIKVLLWNINGKTGPGYTEARRLLVPAIVSKIDPDVLLLQETVDRDLMNIIKSPGNKRQYKDVQTLNLNAKEARVVYDTKKFSLANQEKIFLQGRKTLGDVLKISIERVLSAEYMAKLRNGKIQVLREVIKDRISVTGLRRKLPESPVVIFLSFHNVHTSEGADVRARAMECFCRLVSEIRKLTGCVVLGGADFNQQLIQPYSYPTILDYTPTDRRLRSGQIDYFILDPPESVQESVKPWNFVEANKNASNPLNATMTRLLTEVNKKTGKPYTITEYDEALDHDPLVCVL